MAIKVELPKEIVKTLIEQGVSLRNRQIKAATNGIIKEALEKELADLIRASNSLEQMK